MSNLQLEHIFEDHLEAGSGHQVAPFMHDEYPDDIADQLRQEGYLTSGGRFTQKFFIWVDSNYEGYHQDIQ